MTFVLIANTIKQTTDGSNVTTDAINTTGAKLLVAITCDNIGGTTPTDNKSNTWYSFTARTTGGITTRIHVALGNPSVGSGHTFTKSGGGFPSIAVMAFSAPGQVAWQGYPAENGATTASDTSLQTGSITPKANNDLLVYGLGDAFTTTVSVDVGTIADQAALVGGVAFGVVSAYEIQTTKTTRNPTFSWTTAARTEAAIACFCEFAGVSPTTFDPNTAYTTNYTLTNNNLTFNSTSAAAPDNGAYSTTYKVGGKWYLECSHANVGNNNSRIGLAGPFGVQQLNDMWRNIGDHGLPGMPDCLAIDLDNMKMWGRIGAGDWNNNASADPSTNTLGVSITSAISAGCFFYVDSAEDSGNPSWTVNFGATVFSQALPSGFLPWDNYSGSASMRNRTYRIR
jgi:hypothetical protein